VGGGVSENANGIHYHDGQTPPSESAINAKRVELQAAYDAQEYARLRKEEYDALNQLEMQYDDEVNSTTTWKDAIDAIKAKYPKPE
jgi:hypothetical protein